MSIYRPIVIVEPLDFDKGSTLCLVKVDGRVICSTVGVNSRQDANFRARDEERRIYDEEDQRRRERGLPKVSRPNV